MLLGHKSLTWHALTRSMGFTEESQHKVLYVGEQVRSHMSAKSCTF